MTLRMLDLAFRHKVLLVVPVLVGLVLGIAWFATSLEDEYASSATIEAKPSNYGPAAFQYNPYLSLAQNQTNAMVQWLSTREFTDRVVEQANANGAACLPDRVTRFSLLTGTSIHATGDILVQIGHRTTSACLAPIVVNALLAEYTTFFGDQIRDRAEEDTATLSVQLTRAREDEDAASQAYIQYLSTHPELVDIDPERPTAGVQGDAGFLQLHQTLQTARSITNRTANLLAEAQIAVLTPEGQQPGFEIVDQPDEPNVPVGLGTRALLTKPVMGLAGGLLISAGIFFFLWRRDRSVRLPADLSFLGNGAPVMMLPALQPRRRRWPQSFVRLATGLTNGMNNLG